MPLSSESNGVSTSKRLVGVAIDDPPIALTVNDVLERTRGFQAVMFEQHAVRCGIWPAGAWTAVVTNPSSFETHQRAADPDQYRLRPIVCVLTLAEFSRHRLLLTDADAFVLEDRIDALLPQAIILSAYRLSVMPSTGISETCEVDPRLEQLRDLTPSDLRLLYELSHGLGNGDIANRLGLSEPRAKARIRRVIDRLGFRNRTDAAVYAAALHVNDLYPAATPFARQQTKSR